MINDKTAIETQQIKRNLLEICPIDVFMGFWGEFQKENFKKQIIEFLKFENEIQSLSRITE